MEFQEFKYLVAIQCFTFNHSKYIREALNGFIMQQTNFPFIIMVVDDASTDGEQEIIKNYISEQFNLKDTKVAYEKETDYANITYAQHISNHNCYIVAMYLKENHYSQRKPKLPYLSEWRNKVKYEAVCEGDDYWIDFQKLQKQVKFLESHPDYGLVYTKAKVYNQCNNQFEHDTIGKEAKTFDDLIKANSIGTLTVCYRKYLYDRYINEIDIDPSWLMGDYPKWLFISLNTNIKFLNEVTSVYRKQEQSASHFKEINGQLAFITSSSNICSYFLTYANRWDLKKIYKETYCSIIIDCYISYNQPVDFSFLSKYWLWKPKFILKYVLSQITLTRRFLR